MSRDNAGIAAAIARIEAAVAEVAAVAGSAADAADTADQITLTGVRAHGHHGVFDHEKADGQEFVVDVTVFTDLAAASVSDKLAHTVHYGELAEFVVAEIEGAPTDLIETLAERIAGGVLATWSVSRVRVTVHKPHAPITVPFDDVSVTVVRSRNASTRGTRGPAA